MLAPGPVQPLEQLTSAIDFARYTFNPWGIAYSVAVLAISLLAVLVLWGRGSRANRSVRRVFVLNMALVGVSLTAIGACMGAGDAAQAAAVTRVGLVAACLLGPVTLQFVSVLVGWQAAMRPWVVATYVLGGALGIASLSTDWMIDGAWPARFGWAATAGPLLPLALLQVGACMIGALAVLGGRLRHSTDPRVRRQVRAVIIAYGFGNLTMIDILPAWGVVVIPSSYLWVTISAVVLAVAIHEHQLLDAPDFGWRALAWLFTSALVVLPVLALLLLLSGWRGWGQPAWTTAVLFLIFLVVRAYHVRLQPRIDDLFLRRRRDLSRELGELSEALLVLRTASDIADEVARLLHRALYARLTAFAAREADGWRVLHSAWGTLAAPDDDDPVVRRLAAEPRLLLRGELAGLGAEVAQAGDRLLSRWGAEVLIPIAGQPGELAGLLAVGPRWDARPFEPFEQAFLQQLPKVVAGPLAAARLYDRRHRLREELEEKVAAKSADLARALAGLESAQAQLVQNEKMATLGVVVGGVAAELQAAIDDARAQLPALETAARASEAAAEAYLDALPEGARGAEVRAWVEKSGFDFLRRDVQKIVDAVVEGTRRAHGIAGDLSRFARAGGSEAEPVALAGELEAALNLLAPSFKGRIRVRRDFAADVPPVLCERGPIGQVLMNLLINAGQAIDGDGEILVGLRVVEAAQFVEILVEDSGRGIPPDVLPRIFEPFFTTKPLGQSGGSGLGLSISYGIVQRHGGRIEVESAVGKGTSMRVILPIAGAQRLGKAS